MIDELDTTARVARPIHDAEDPFGIDATPDDAHDAAHARETALRIASEMRLHPEELLPMAKWLMEFSNGAAWPGAARRAFAIARQARPVGIVGYQSTISEVYAFLRGKEGA